MHQKLIERLRKVTIHKNNFTALSVGDILPVLSPSLWPCEINYLKIYNAQNVYI